MIVTCEGCQTRFQLDDERIPSQGVRVRCSCCRHGFFVAPVAKGPCLETSTDALDAPAEEDVGSVALSEHFDRAVEEDRADVLARESPPIRGEISEVGAEWAGFDSASSDPLAAAAESPHPVRAEALSDVPEVPSAPPRPLHRIAVRRTPGVDDTSSGRLSRASLWQVPRPARLGRTASLVGWTLTLGLVALGLLWEIRGSLAG